MVLVYCTGEGSLGSPLARLSWITALNDDQRTTYLHASRPLSMGHGKVRGRPQMKRQLGLSGRRTRRPACVRQRSDW